MQDNIYKPSPIAYVLEWWEIDCGDLGTHKITERQIEAVLEAEKMKVRFVRFEDIVINVAFVRGAKKVTKRRTLDSLNNFPLDKKDEPFLVEDNRKKLLKSGD